MALHVGHYLTKRENGEKVPDAVDAKYPFSHVGDRLRDADWLLGNLECVVSPKGLVATDHNPLRAPLFVPKLLKNAGVDLVSLANNHSLDFGTNAFEDTMARLTAEGVPFIGGHVSSNGPEEPFITTVNGIKIGYLGFYLREQDGLVADVKRARPKVDLLVTFFHWGADDQTEPLKLQRDRGKAVIDAGADLVVGTHTHVLQPEEWYKGKLIFYGLGNFVFSGMNFDDKHRTGAYLEVDVGPKGLLDRRMYRTTLDGVGAPHWLDPDQTDPPLTTGSEQPNLPARRQKAN